MNDSKMARQIVAELPSLVAQNVIDEGAAAALRLHYERQIRPSRSVSIGLAISAILGGMLVGAGIILLLAHNWDALTRPVRAIVAVLPLLACIALSCRAILRHMDSAAWREGCGTFYFLSIGASIALVSQTYHLYNDMAGFLLAWALLSLPLVYLLKSGAAFTGYLVCVTAYAFATGEYKNEFGLFYALFWLALAMPFYACLAWSRRDSPVVAWLSWALAVALPIMAVPYYRGMDSSGVLICHGLLFTVYYLVSCCCFGGLRGIRGPFRSIGSLGLAVVAVCLTFSFVHGGCCWRHGHGVLHEVLPWLICAILVALPLGGFMLWRKISFNWGAAWFPLFVLLALAPGVAEGSNWMPLVMNVYVLALGVFTLVRGVRGDSLFSMNEGMLLVSALVVCRFFDSDYGFIARGVAFILIGCGFLAANVLVLAKRRRRKGAPA